MPDIDVTDVLASFSIADQEFEVVRRFETVNQYGESILREERIPQLLGSVQPTGDNSLTREEGYSAQANTIRVITTYRLNGLVKLGVETIQPDLVFWKGGYYLVKSTNDYTQFGAGFVEADCIAFAYVPPGSSPREPAVGKLDFSQSGNSGLGGH